MTENQLIAELCVRAGMILENVCAAAVSASADDPGKLIRLVEDLQHPLDQSTALLQAAAALLRLQND